MEIGFPLPEMNTIRLIARLDVKGPNLIKGIHLEGLRVLGKPHDFALKYYHEGIDELIFMDAVASLYQRNQLHEIVEKVAHEVFVPLTVGGGVRSLEDARQLLRSGADKVAVNTAAVEDPFLISRIAESFGSQCVVHSIEAKRDGRGGWEAFTDCGREHTGLSVVEWAVRGAQLGAGEILITSVDQEGTKRGFDIGLVRAVADAVKIPVIASGGMGTPKDLVTVAKEGHASAVAVANVFHYGLHSVTDLRAFARQNDVPVREV